jgi:U1 small nuclear ribonucleoprotein 70kDa
LNYKTSDIQLKREFEQFGIIKSVVLVRDRQGKSRGYAFIEFDKEQDMIVAYKRADGKKIDDRRIVVDVERGRYYIRHQSY